MQTFILCNALEFSFGFSCKSKALKSQIIHHAYLLKRRLHGVSKFAWLLLILFYLFISYPNYVSCITHRCAGLTLLSAILN